MQMGFYFDQTRCIGCYACSVACKDWHNVPAGPSRWRHVLTIEEGKFPNPFVTFLSTACYHCARPFCAEECPADAIQKRDEDGIVVVNQELCLGKDSCGLCREACPYDIPQFRVEENAKMEKCTFCLDRLASNENPICVDACPLEALDFGFLEDLKSKYGDVTEATGFTYSGNAGPSILFRPKISRPADG